MNGGFPLIHCFVFLPRWPLPTSEKKAPDLFLAFLLRIRVAETYGSSNIVTHCVNFSKNSSCCFTDGLRNKKCDAQKKENRLLGSVRVGDEKLFDFFSCFLW
ncbi:hypothetical protein DITRI_Ditri05aG0104700 [Diplodiscus trichospermus]